MKIIENSNGQLQFDIPDEPSKWNKLKEWLEHQKEERKYAGDAYRYTAYGAVLHKMEHLERE